MYKIMEDENTFMHCDQSQFPVRCVEHNELMGCVFCEFDDTIPCTENHEEEKVEYVFKIVSWNDKNNYCSFNKEFYDCLSAIRCFESFVDHGIADEFRTVNLFEPNGKCHTKIFYRGGKVVTR
jgi:hypothetical protein